MTDAQLKELFKAVIDVARACIEIAEAAGEYTYEEVEEKRWVLGPGGASGQNCETCEENADTGWIGMDDTFIDVSEDDIDEPPGHPNCECTVEYRTRRHRVYV